MAKRKDAWQHGQTAQYEALAYTGQCGSFLLFFLYLTRFKSLTLHQHLSLHSASIFNLKNYLCIASSCVSLLAIKFYKLLIPLNKLKGRGGNIKGERE